MVHVLNELEAANHAISPDLPVIKPNREEQPGPPFNQSTRGSIDFIYY